MDETTLLTSVLKVHDAGDLGEKCVVLAAPDISSGLEPRAALADENGAPGDFFAGESFDSEPLGVAVPAVPGASLAFFVRHI